MGGLDDATEHHISCLCPKGFLAMTSCSPAYLGDINASVAANLMESGLSRNLGIRPCKSSVNQAIGSLCLTQGRYNPQFNLNIIKDVLTVDAWEAR